MLQHLEVFKKLAEIPGPKSCVFMCGSGNTAEHPLLCRRTWSSVQARVRPFRHPMSFNTHRKCTTAAGQKAAPWPHQRDVVRAYRDELDEPNRALLDSTFK